MSISRALKEKFESYDLESTDRIIRMAWEDRTSYESITLQFNLTPSEIVHFMRFHMDASRFKRWRKRIFEKGKLKNSPHSDYRFKCASQRLDGSTKNHK
jgi:uncharacterized protein (TIGR03643 family)